MTARLAAFGAISAAGEGRDAASAGAIGEAPRVVITRDAELEAAGLARPFAARAAVPEAALDRASWLVVRAARACAERLDRERPGWRARRVGLVLGTSSGGMRSAERLFDGDTQAAGAATYFAGFQEAARALAMDLEPATLVLCACSSATVAIGLAMRWLDAGACDLVLAGGYDAVSVFVASGFEVLRATSADGHPRPFRTDRDGMALGEGAAILALEAAGATGGSEGIVFGGFGASADGVHLTAPDRDGEGLARAASLALADAGLTGSAVDIVSAHGTATPFNDAAEARAIATVTGDRASFVVHPYKAQIGHTLGAAGALEALACVDALERGVLPAAAGAGPVDPDARVALLDVAAKGEPLVALKLSAAFGGANAALVIHRAGAGGRSEGAHPRLRRPVFLVGAADAAEGGEWPPEVLAERLGWTVDRLLRADPLVRRALAAIARVALRHGAVRGGGVVVGQSFATLETNLLFHKRIRMRGARMAEPRRFPYTSPNAVAGEASIAFGLTGPSFAVGSGLHAGVEAIGVAVELVGAGDAEAMVAVATDEVGSAVAAAARGVEGSAVSPVSGAVAVLLSSRAEGAIARVGAVRLHVGRDEGREGGRTPVGHQALSPLFERPVPRTLEAWTPLGRGRAAKARVDLEPPELV